jgi:hypothetical protein
VPTAQSGPEERADCAIGTPRFSRFLVVAGEELVDRCRARFHLPSHP